MTAPRLTPAMVAALRLASEDAIRYYLGGTYTTPRASGYTEQRFLISRDVRESDVPTTTPGTLRALVSRGLLDFAAMPVGIYNHRWTITPAGRDALAREDATK